MFLFYFTEESTSSNHNIIFQLRYHNCTDQSNKCTEQRKTIYTCGSITYFHTVNIQIHQERLKCLFSCSERMNPRFPVFCASPVPSILFPHTCLNLLWILMLFLRCKWILCIISPEVNSLRGITVENPSVLPLVRTTCKFYLSPSQWRDPPSVE